MKMSFTKIFSVVVIVTVLCATSLVEANPVELFSDQRGARQQGGAVLFYVSYQGTLRDILYNPILFNEVIVNQGSGYHNETGRFIAPVSGIYQFVFAAQICRGDHNNAWYFMINGQRRMTCHAQVAGLDTTLNTCYCMEDLKKGDQVWIKQNPGSCAWASTISKTITFSGVLLSSEGVSMLGGKQGFGSSCPLPSLGRIWDTVSSSEGPSASLSSVAFALLFPLVLIMPNL